MSHDKTRTNAKALPGRAALVLIAVSAAQLFWSGASASVEGAFSVAEHDPRGLAMGGACVSLAAGDAAVRWNPARLPYISARSITAAYGELIEDFPSGFVTISFAVPWGREPRPDVPFDTGGRWGAGAFLSRLGLDEIADSAAWSETALSGAIARTLTGYLSAGIAVRYLNVSSDVDEGSANGVSADLALSVNTTDRTRAAVVVRNVPGRLNWKSGRNETLPISADLAISYVRERWASAELSFHFNENGLVTTSLGLETSPVATGLVLWGGLKRHRTTSPRSIPSFGVGVPAGGVMIAYGISFDEDTALGTAQRFSVSASF
jgi:hypothetical protein